MIAIRPLRPEDIPAIRSWPPYPPEFAMPDYSLRDGGWLDEYSKKDGSEILVAEDGRDRAGFSVLSREPGGTAEFRIALHPHRLLAGPWKDHCPSHLKPRFLRPGPACGPPGCQKE
ncbi:MAG: hypothetical protein M0R30_01960 [Methanoregula sp.]|nr:hypothetical protein [Methanoregula sp.]